MSAGHIYHYFENKEAIVAAIIEQEQQRHLQIIHMLLDADSTIDALIQFAEQTINESLDLSNSTLNFEIIAEASRNAKVLLMLQQSTLILRQHGKEIINKARADLPAISEAENDARCDLIISLFDGLRMRAICNPHYNIQTILPVLQRSIVHIVLS
ncbi:TetR/AcrR family transcriptional regulator [Chitinibacter sp. S2-10]|uniref:TetR/AcrR family transcriptional regulator n=1 Tax=Chitinibacter sp. S2-10 TaxID=3373597 RepID=UPI003977C770